MKKPFILSLAVLSFSALSFVGLSSCSGDDGTEDDPNKSEKEAVFGEPADHLPKASDYFYGFWQTSEGPNSFILYSDGTCKGISNTAMSSIGTGEWTYNLSTNILSTTLQSSQYQVTLCNKTGTAWTSVQLGSNKAQTFHKAAQIFNPSKGTYQTSSYFTPALLCGSSWTDGSNTIQFGPSMATMLYTNSKDKRSTYQYVKRIVEFAQSPTCTDNKVYGTYKVKSYVNYASNYRWINDVSSTFEIENYLSSDPILRLGSEPGSEYHLAK